MRKYIFILLLLSLAIGCRDNRRLDAALEFAGENRVELERVLEHYRDSGLKYEAARFLIENMPGYYGYYRGVTSESRKALLSSADTTGTILPYRVDRWQYGTEKHYEKLYDVRVIKADYLIDNIDRAFAVWQERPWNKYLSFEDFCETILPYRIGNEALEYWRDKYEKKYAYLLDSVYRGTDVVEAAATVEDRLREEGFLWDWKMSLPHLGPSFLMEHHRGSCRDANDLILYIMRSLGIPTVIDFYTYAPELRRGHSWTSVRDTTGKYVGMQQFTKERLNRNICGLDGRKSGKILRRCFAYPYYKDVSDNYFADTLKIDVPDCESDKLYIGIFHPAQYWEVMDSAVIRDGRAVFPNVESEVIFAPLCKKRNRGFTSIDYPIYFDGKRVHHYVPDTVSQDTVVLWRKYPLFRKMALYLKEFYGGKFEFSNRKDFKEIAYAYTVRDTPCIAYNEVILPRKISCRYVRYVAPEGKRTDMGELLFYGGGWQYKPVDIRCAEVENAVNVQNMVDGDPLTFYFTGFMGSTILMDFGKQVVLDSFVFIPRNDDNFIRPGDEYELFYHGGRKGWVSLGRKIARGVSLSYVVPRGALFHLRCLTRGKEEQVFQIEKGKQVFISNFD